MKIQTLTDNGSRRILLLFLGWGISADQLPPIVSRYYRILTLEDYSDFSPADVRHYFGQLLERIKDADEVAVMAWSFGVRIATDFLSALRKDIPLTCTIAINGTPFHINDTKGIPASVFRGTLANLSRENVRKFNRRMFTDASAFNEFSTRMSSRSLENMRDELELFGSLPECADLEPGIWERAVVSTDDRIFSGQSQLKAWKELGVPVRLIEGGHFPDFQQLVDIELVDKDHVAESFGKSLSTYSDSARPQAVVARKLWDLLDSLNISIAEMDGRLLEIGCGTGLLTDLYVPRLKQWQIELWDIAPISTRLSEKFRFVCCDAETEIRNMAPESLDMILSSSCLQWFNSPARFVEEASRSLKAGGMFAVALYGDQTFREIVSVTGKSLAYPSLSSLIDAAERSGLEVIHSSEEVLPIEFDSPADLLRHIRHTGVGAISSVRDNTDTPSLNVSGLKVLRYLAEHLEPEDSKCRLTYHPIYLIARKPSKK